MKTKTVVAIIVTILLVGLTLYAIPVKAQQYLKIGIIGPVGLPQYQGMVEGAIIAQEWINGPGGGIVIGGVRYDVSIHTGDDHSVDQDPAAGAAEMERLITDEGVDLVLGGFRSENVFWMREVAMDYNELFFICGASTNELVDCGTGTCGACVRCDYARYKYLFGVNFNQTTLLKNLVGFLRGYALPYRLAPLYGVQLDPDPELDIKTAVIAEDLPWTVGLYNAIVYGGYLGPQANIVYAARTPYGTTDFLPYLDAMHAAQVRLIVHLYSTPDSIAFISQWAIHPIKAIPVGIDAFGQCSEFWPWTGGACQYETLLAASGTRSPISTTSQPYTTVEFWDLYNATYGHAPIYTSFGAYETIIAMHDLLEAQTAITPPFDMADADALVPIIEATDRESVLGKFKFTQYHDPFSNEYGSTWTQRYVRPLVVQWQAGRLEVVWPLNQAYSKIWVLPDEPGEMYPYPHDVNQDGKVNDKDASIVQGAYGSYPGHPTWQFAADAVRDNYIDVCDSSAVQAYLGKTVALPLLYCNEGGWPPPPPCRLMRKTLSATEGELGDVVHVTLTVKLPADETVAVVDTLPEGFSYINGTFVVDGVPSTPVIVGPNVTYTITTPGIHDLEFDVKVDKAKAWEDWEVCNVALATWYDAEGNVIGTKEDTVDFVIHAFEQLHKNVGIPKADVVFAIDLTDSMLDEIAVLKAEATNIMNTLAAQIADVQFGLISFMDYHGKYSTTAPGSFPLTYTTTYGWAPSGDYPYKLDQDITSDIALMTAKINALALGWGFDLPQDYTRIIYESYSDANLHWRTGAKKILILFGDSVPHDSNFDFDNNGVPNNTGGDPGRNAVLGDGDDLDFETEVANAAAAGVHIMAVYSGSSGSKYPWTYMTSQTGGEYSELTAAGQIPDAITELIKKQALETLVIKEKTETQWAFVIDVANPFPYTMTNVVITDMFGAEIESDPPFPYSITHGTVSYYTKGTSAKVFLTWNIGNLLLGETARLIVLVSTDINPAGKQEYSEPGVYELNSGATLKFIDPEQNIQLSAYTDSIYVTVLPLEDP